jgi:hypothetical protein
MTRREFPRTVKIKCLLWSDRHCCLCGKQCGTDIEIAHIDEKGAPELKNAIPLCYDCHAKIGHYRNEHPKGNKYQPDELTSRRDQVYETFTSHLIPPIDYQVVQISKFPDVSFLFTHLGGPYPARLKVKVEVILGNNNVGILPDQYNGNYVWNLNPRHRFRGHINLPKATVESTQRLELDTTITIIDIYQREHVLLPMAHIYDRTGNTWFAEPCPFIQREV